MEWKTKSCIYTLVNRNFSRCWYIFFSNYRGGIRAFLLSFLLFLFDSWKRIETFGSRRNSLWELDPTWQKGRDGPEVREKSRWMGRKIRGLHYIEIKKKFDIPFAQCKFNYSSRAQVFLKRENRREEEFCSSSSRSILFWKSWSDAKMKRREINNNFLHNPVSVFRTMRFYLLVKMKKKKVTKLVEFDSFDRMLQVYLSLFLK